MKAMHNGTRTRSKDSLDVLRGDIAAIRSDIASLVEERLERIGTRARDTISAASDGVHTATKFATDRAESAHKQLRSAAGSRPLTTIAIAAAAGAMGATILGWMRHK
jgi:ElaB/YqjD/DUF883 family membrane-anchored ribosome-binding protein